MTNPNNPILVQISTHPLIEFGQAKHQHFETIYIKGDALMVDTLATLLSGKPEPEFRYVLIDESPTDKISVKDEDHLTLLIPYTAAVDANLKDLIDALIALRDGNQTANQLVLLEDTPFPPQP